MYDNNRNAFFTQLPENRIAKEISRSLRATFVFATNGDDLHFMLPHLEQVTSDVTRDPLVVILTVQLQHR